MPKQELAPSRPPKWVHSLLHLGIFLLISVVGVVAVTVVEMMYGITYPSDHVRNLHWLVLMLWGASILGGQQLIDRWFTRQSR